MVLMYHDVYSREASESGFQNATAMKYKVSTEAFEQQVAAVRADAKAHALHVSVCQIIFLQIAPEQRLGARAQSL